MHAVFACVVVSSAMLLGIILNNDQDIESSMPRYLSFCSCDPDIQAGVANLCISSDPAVIVKGRDVGMDGMLIAHECMMCFLVGS